jgi:hypothetical protein
MSSCCIAYEKRTGQILLVHFGLQADGWEETLKSDALDLISTRAEVGVMRIDSEAFKKDRLYKVDPTTLRVVASSRDEPGFSCSAVAHRRSRA